MTSLFVAHPVARKAQTVWMQNLKDIRSYTRISVNYIPLNTTLCHLSITQMIAKEQYLSTTGIPMDRERSVNSVTQQ
jgi:hypothetical protein